MNANTLLLSTQVLLILLFVVVMALFVKGLISTPARKKRQPDDAAGHATPGDAAVDDGHIDRP